YEGKLKVVGQTFSTEKYGVGLTKGDTATCEKVNAAITKMVDDGSWQKALADTVGADFKPDASANPPKPEPCS
ncbi:MAG: transporter substrate-binding domain-containing protein, partial [Propionibacteriaceae bacterium]